MRYAVMMDFGEDGVYEYGRWSDRDQANDIAMEVRAERGCHVFIEEVE